MQTEPTPLLICAEPKTISVRYCPHLAAAALNAESGRCDMCEYKSLCDQWTWDDMSQIVKEGLSNAQVETSVDFVKKLESLCTNPLLASVMTPDILSTIDINNWFIQDYCRRGGYYRTDPITNEQVRVPRRRFYYWDDEMTNYEALCQTIVNLLSVIDDWVWDEDEGETYPMLYSKVDGEKTMIASIIDIYDTMIDMYFTVSESESENEECDSVS
jgi:hypothetical protein